MNDDFLYKFRKPPRHEFAAALYQRIAKPMKTTSRTRTLRALALAFSMLVLVAGVLFFSPSTRAMADSVIRRIGGVIFVQATPQAGPATSGEDMAGQRARLSPEQEAAMQQTKIASRAEDMAGPQATISPEQKAALAQTKTASQAEAPSQAKEGQKTNNPGNAQPALDAGAVSQLVGFSVLAPAYLPDGYTAASGGWRVSQENDPAEATLNQINVKVGLVGVSGGAIINYVNPAAGGILTVEELKAQQGQSKTIDIPEIEDVTVRGQPGAWMPDIGGMSILAWEEKGITYLVVGNPLSQDEAVKVAESLGK
jgi:hypothetical protein